MTVFYSNNLPSVLPNSTNFQDGCKIVNDVQKAHCLKNHCPAHEQHQVVVSKHDVYDQSHKIGHF